MTIPIRRARSQDVEELFHKSTQFLQKLYPADSNHLVSSSELLSKPNLLIVALGNAGPVGCAGFLRIDKYAEVKRLFVVSSQRRQGIGRALMQELERHALRAGLSTMKLETGAHQKNSQLLYKSMGYKIGSAFGLYKNDPLSVFMTKNL